VRYAPVAGGSGYALARLNASGGDICAKKKPAGFFLAKIPPERSERRNTRRGLTGIMRAAWARRQLARVDKVRQN